MFVCIPRVGRRGLSCQPVISYLFIKLLHIIYASTDKKEMKVKEEQKKEKGKGERERKGREEYHSPLSFINLLLALCYNHFCICTVTFPS